MTIVSERIWNWLKNATPEERQAFLAGGEPSIKSTLALQDGTMQHYPALRGVVVEDVPYTDPEEARERARKLRDERAASDSLPEIDTEWLGLWNQEAHRQADEVELRTNSIVHIATSLLSPGYGGRPADTLMDMGVDLELEDSKNLPSEIRDCLPSEQDYEDEEEMQELFVERLRDRGVMGFLVQCSTPVPRKTEEGWTWFSWSMTRPGWFYGETFREAFEKAVEWAKEIHWGAESDQDTAVQNEEESE